MHSPCRLQPLTDHKHHVEFCRRQTSSNYWVSANLCPALSTPTCWAHFAPEGTRRRGMDQPSVFPIPLASPRQRLEAQARYTRTTATTDPSHGCKRVWLATLTDSISKLVRRAHKPSFLRCSVHVWMHLVCKSFIDFSRASISGPPLPPSLCAPLAFSSSPQQPIRRAPAVVPAACL